MGALQLTGQRLQLGVGGQGCLGAVGRSHPLRDDRAQRRGQPVFDIADLSGEGLARCTTSVLVSSPSPSNRA
jgi:hypothetical protein